MKTLDEVIQEFERQEAFVVYYMQDKTQFRSDALHYLKEYRDLKETMDWHEEMENIRNNLTNLLMNPALTWEELRQFEGGPVYVKLLGTYEGYPNASRWMLVQSDVSFGNVWFIDRSGARYCFYEKDMNDIWQAFRKEK